MKVSEALLKRKSTRAFLSKNVEKEKIESILNFAKHSPSGVNMQPWEVCVVSGKSKKNLENKMITAFKSENREKMDYNYYPLKWEEPFKSRRKETGLLMYSTLKITKEDREKQLRQWALNYKAFGAPVVMFFFINSNLEKGSFLDYGMFLQSIMLIATELGLATCPQVSLAEFPTIVKEQLNIEKEKILVCGIALGYEDRDALINSYRTDRLKLEEFTKFYE